jgi:hypothetical protein
MLIRMTTTATYRTWVVLFRRLKYSGLVIAILGGLIGFVANASGRIVIWIVSGLLAIWLYAAGLVEQRRYEPVLYQSQQGQGSDPARRTLRMTTPMDSPSNDDQLGRPPDPSRTDPLRLGGSERESLRLSTLHRYERFFTRLAFAGVGITIAGIVISFFVDDGARAAIIGGLGVGGLGISAMSLVIRKRIRTGPKRGPTGS